MKNFKRTIENGQSINAQATSIMNEMAFNMDTTSIKVVNSILGSRAQKSEMIALALASGKTLAERVDSTFIFPCDFVSEHFDEFSELVTTINRHNAYKLEVLRRKLNDQEIEDGKRIAILRKVRELVMLKLSDTAYTEEDVFNYMKAEGYYVEGKTKYVADMKLGRMTSERRHELQKVKDVLGRDRYVMVLDVIGASAIPVTTDETRNIAVNYMIDFQEKYDEEMMKWIKSEDRSHESLLEVMKCLWPQDMKEQMDVESIELTDKDKDRAKELADKIVGGMRDVR